VALNNVWSPYVYENYKKVNFTKEVSRLYKIVLYGLIFLTFNLSLMSKDIVLLLSNPSYIKASKYFILLCFPMCVYLLLPFVSVAVNLNRETKYLSYSYVSGSVFNLVLLILLLPRFGIMIVPVSLAISRIINYIILYNYAKKKINVLYPNKLLIIFLIVNILCFIIMQFDIHRFYIYGITLLLDIMFIYWTNKKFKWINLFLRKNNYSIKP
jgi:O-antigen/teichoic acid export membrane protein